MAAHSASVSVSVMTPLPTVSVMTDPIVAMRPPFGQVAEPETRSASAMTRRALKSWDEATRVFECPSDVPSTNDNADDIDWT